MAGGGIVFALDAVSFLVLVCAAMALRIRRRGEDPDVSPTGRRRVLRSLLPTDGVAALRSARVLWVLVLALLPFIVTVESVNVVEVFLVRDVLGASLAQYGLGEVVASSAAIVGSFVAGSILHEQTRVRAIVWALFGCAAAQVGQGLAPSFPWYLLGAASSGSCSRSGTRASSPCSSPASTPIEVGSSPWSTASRGPAPPSPCCSVESWPPRWGRARHTSSWGWPGSWSRSVPRRPTAGLSPT
ncbi:MAG: hypothetical protein IPM00_07215 [Tetrasphaera sp.]|nr:hypothetical protein [Tetrasphaera sp.]